MQAGADNELREILQTREAAMPEAICKAHRHSIRHRDEIMASAACGCFYCLAIYSPSEIAEWIDEHATAICPKCGIDSVIGEASGFPVTPEFLAGMKANWFSNTV